MRRTQTNGDANLLIGRAESPRSALILGGARNLFSEIEKAESLFTPDIIIATNHAGVNFARPFDYWCSFHPDKFPDWIERRRKFDRPMPPMLVTARHRRSVVMVLTKKTDLGIPIRFIDSWGGSSGLLAVTLALGLGCQRVVLAGVPLEKQDAHFDSDKPWLEASKYRAAWLQHVPQMRKRVRSFSGWTAEQLGVVTEEWLRNEIAA